MPDDVLTRPPSSVRPEAASGTQDATDAQDLGRFGYKQELRRVLGVYSSFAVAFSYISPSTGIFTLFAPIGLAIAGPFFFWSWPLVALGQFIIALNFAEVSSHFPVAGSVYQWTKYLSNRGYSWMTGWIYLFAGVLTVTAVVATIPGLVLIPLLNTFGLTIANTAQTQVAIALVILASTTLLNIFGVRLVALINNTGVVFEILGMVVFALVLLIFYHHQPASVVFDSHYLGTGFTGGAFLAAMFMSLFVIYGFDTASTLAEETKNPRLEAPKAVLASVVGAFIIGTVFLLALIIAIPDMGKFVAGAGASPPTITSPADVLTAVLPSWMAQVYLIIVLAAIYVCCLAIQTATIRLAFGMARDGKLPLARLYNKVSPSLHTPVITCIVVGALAAVPFIYYAGAGLIAIAATGMIYLSYLLGNIAILIARLRGWPTANAPFKLGGWGMIVNILALAWGGSMLVNFLWLRPASNPTLNTYLNPTGAAGGASLGGFGDFLPIFEAVVAVIVVVGAIYYLVAQRGKTDQVVRAA
jgi:amino acid transporter